LLTGISSIVIHFFESKIAIIISIIGFCILIRNYLNYIITAKRESTFNGEVDKFSKKEIQYAKIGVVCNYLACSVLLLFVLYFVLYPQKNCKENDSVVGIIITSFSKGSNDNFSYNLTDYLLDQVSNDSTISIVAEDSFFKVQNQNYTYEINTHFSSNCLIKGLFVYGKRDIADKLFDCNIFINNLQDIRIPKKIYHSDNIIYLENPDILNFSLDMQSKTIGEFILALLKFNSKNYDESIERFKTVIKLNNDTNSIRLASYCYFFIGNNLLAKNNPNSAIVNYKTAISIDSSNQFFHYNLGIAFLSEGDFIDGSKELVISNLNEKHVEEMLDSIQQRKAATPVITSLPKISRNKQVSTIIESKNNSYVIQSDSVVVNNDTIQGIEDIVERSMRRPLHYIISMYHGNYGVMYNGAEVIGYAYDTVINFNYKNHILFVIKSKNKFGVLSKDGKNFIPLKHPSAEMAESAAAFVLDASNDNTNTLGL
jgi:tetratricopeptide (TPR) repeat protein